MTVSKADSILVGENTQPLALFLVAELYITLFNSIRTDPTTPHGRNGFYFGESGEHRLYDVSLGIGKALVALGKSDKAEPTTFTQDDLNKHFGVRLLQLCVRRTLHRLILGLR